MISPAVIVLAAFAGSPDDSGGSPAIPPEFKPGDDRQGFPLRHGFRWTYRITGGVSGREAEWFYLETHPGPEIDGERTTRLAVKEMEISRWGDMSDLYLTKRGAALFQHAKGNDFPREVFPKRRQRLPDAFVQGDRLPFAATALDQEDVRVPAGDFTGWKIKYGHDWLFGTEHDLCVYYTPGIGLVKLDAWREPTGRENTPLPRPITAELVRIEPLSTAHRVDFPSAPEPVARLPGSAVAPDGQLTLFADYEDVWEDQVVVYAINKTSEAVDLPAEEGKIYLKLEAWSSDGRWERAQKHSYSFCGNASDIPLTIEPGHFMAFLGYRPEKGETREVRYRLYDSLGLASNAGRGPVDPVDILRARYDDMGIPQACLRYVEDVLFGEVELPADELVDARRNAVERLAYLPSVQSRPVVERLLSMPELSGIEYEDVLEVVERWPELHEAHVLEVLRGFKNPRRTVLLAPPWFQHLPEQSPRVTKLLLSQARSPETPHLQEILDYAASGQEPAVWALLKSIQGDPRYPQQVRVHAEYQVAARFSQRIVEIRIQRADAGALSEAALHDAFDITLENLSARTLRFSYEEPAQILALYARLGGQYLVPRSGVTWFGPPAGKTPATKVVLEPLERHTLRVRLMDYFDIPAGPYGEDAALWIAAACQIPNGHASPQGGEWVKIK